jgi:DNA mismatch repair protein MutL
MTATRIRRLPDHLINKIAAGEVVERPAAVVKELIENALDAEATTIGVDLGDGGARLVSVTDDGIGMSTADLELALARHATSKISSEADLAVIATLGFRGEALPAICAVSRFTIVSCPRGAREGLRLRGEGGSVTQRILVPTAAGTRVDIADLFYNTPARLKFLKSPPTELAATLRLLTQLALAYPGVQMRVVNNKRTLLSAPRAGSLADRAGAILGFEVAERLLPIEGSREGARVRGLVSPPALARGARDAITLIVNGRPVRDTLLAQTVLDAYRPLLARDRFPVAIVTLELPPAEVDVNVHPTKAWIRFRNPRLVQEILFAAVQEALRQPAVVPPLGGSAPTGTSRAAAHESGASGATGHESGTDSMGDAEAAQAALFAEAPAAYRSGLFGRLLGQVQDTFIVATSDAEVFFVDQHVAHERVLFERLRTEASRGPLPSQELLFPKPLPLPPAARAMLESMRPTLTRLGFAVGGGPGDTVELRAVPTVLAGHQAARLVDRLVDELSAVRGEAPEIDRVLAFVACRAAIKANVALAREEMERLLAALSATETPYFCPHGRPIVSRVSLNEIRKELKRSW